jgi:hypothetical protein
MRCVVCDLELPPHRVAHTVHDEDCTDAVLGWCRCPDVACPDCCPSCHPAPKVERVRAFALASTAGLPRKAIA